jgi:hypothetical protein
MRPTITTFLQTAPRDIVFVEVVPPRLLQATTLAAVWRLRDDSQPPAPMGLDGLRSVASP